MNNNTLQPQDVATMDDEDLVQRIADLERIAEYTHREGDRARLELTQRMQARGARELPHERYKIALRDASPKYDQTKLRALWELLPESVMLELYTPAHTEEVTVPEKWDGRKLNTAKKYGDTIAGVIDDAKIPQRPRLIVEAR